MKNNDNNRKANFFLPLQTSSFSLTIKYQYEEKYRRGVSSLGHSFIHEMCWTTVDEFCG